MFVRVILETSDWLNVTSVICETVGALAIAIGFFKYWGQIRSKRKEKALSMAKYYADEIIPKTAVLWERFTDRNLRFNMRHIITTRSLTRFDSTELSRIEPDIIEKLKKVYAAPRKEDFDFLKKNKIKEAFIEEAFEEATEKWHKWRKEMNNDLVNRLEYFSMELMSRSADEKSVYESLHMAFLEIVSCLYYYIAVLNQNQQDKYLVSTIELYNLWNVRLEKEMQKDNDRQKKAVSKKLRRQRLSVFR